MRLGEELPYGEVACSTRAGDNYRWRVRGAGNGLRRVREEGNWVRGTAAWTYLVAADERRVRRVRIFLVVVEV